MLTADSVIESINRYAADSKPFLFGIDFEQRNGFFIPDPLANDELLWRVGENSNFTRQTNCATKSFTSHPISFDQFMIGYKTVEKGLNRGDSFLANYTIRTPITTDYSMAEIALCSNSQYLLYIPELRFVCFSPERFVHIDRNGRISSNPMKGTIDAAIPNAAQVILDDYKEQAEHYTIVDLIRSDLSRVATNIRVERLRYIDCLQTTGGKLLQVSSEIAGDLPTDWKNCLGDTLMTLLPAGSISGAPKRRTVELIRQAENNVPRGYYCGIFGYFDGAELDSSVMIRYIEEVEGELRFRSGGGITINSDPMSEYHEMIRKVYLPF